MRSTLLLILIGLFSIALASCGLNKKDTEGNKLIPTDVVKNTSSASGDNKEKRLPVIEFEEEEHDFGKIIQGEIVTYGFKFENIGKKDLLIYKVRTSCGCTVTDYPTTPIKPGEDGVINVTFDSKGRKGFQRKTATIIANTEPNTKQIKIKSIIIIPEY